MASSLVGALLGVAFGHRDLQTSPASFLAVGIYQKKKFIRVTDGALGHKTR
jgi:hypothetical protein